MGEYFLFARPTFSSGIARVLDLGGTLSEYNSYITPELADFYAILSDWSVVGLDIAEAMETYSDELADHGEE